MTTLRRIIFQHMIEAGVGTHTANCILEDAYDAFSKEQPSDPTELVDWVHTSLSTASNAMAKARLTSWEYIFDINRARSAVWHEGTTPWTPDMWLTAFVGELGEMANVMKKVNRLTTGARGRSSEQNIESLQASLEEEAADATLYWDLLMQSMNVQLKRAVIRKFNETSREYGFDEFMLSES